MKTFPIRPHFSIKTSRFQIDLGPLTKIMGIVNITPDSFSNDGCWDANPSARAEKALKYTKHLIKEGAHIIDIGGESSRPGSRAISVREEISRVIPIVKNMSQLSIPISVDTYKPTVAQHALDSGASIINNIKGLVHNRPLLKMIRNYDAAVVLMHMRGTPHSMQKNIAFSNPVKEIIHELRESIEKYLEIGIKSDKIIIDPGIGFGKTVEHNLYILGHLREFHTLGQPLLIGTSRKSFIGEILNRKIDQRLMGTAATVCTSILNGVHIVRVHDVQQTADAVKMMDKILAAQQAKSA